MLFYLLAASTAQIDACALAVHGDLASAATACTEAETVDLSKPGLTPECSAALTAGLQAGKYGPVLPEAARNGLIKQFDSKLQACRAPAPKPEIPVRPTVNLWD